MTKWICSDILKVKRNFMQIYKTYKSFYAMFEDNVFFLKTIEIEWKTKTNKYVMFVLKRILSIQIQIKHLLIEWKYDEEIK